MATVPSLERSRRGSEASVWPRSKVPGGSPGPDPGRPESPRRLRPALASSGCAASPRRWCGIPPDLGIPTPLRSRRRTCWPRPTSRPSYRRGFRPQRAAANWRRSRSHLPLTVAGERSHLARGQGRPAVLPTFGGRRAPGQSHDQGDRPQCSGGRPLCVRTSRLPRDEAGRALSGGSVVVTRPGLWALVRRGGLGRTSWGEGRPGSGIRSGPWAEGSFAAPPRRPRHGGPVSLPRCR